MIRLFVAIDIPTGIRQRLIADKPEIDGLRWQSEERLHLTLKFLGNVNIYMFSQLKQQLKTVPVVPFGLQVSGAGVFRKPDGKGVLWAGVNHSDALSQLHREIEHLTTAMGVAPGSSFDVYTPHITLARWKSGVNLSAVNNWVVEHRSTDFGAFEAASFKLYSSRSSPSGAVYTPMAEYSAIESLA